MGDTGPCGPCSEIHYDMGVVASDQGHTNCEFGCDCGRYVEIWNLVFMQFDRDPSGKLNPLPKPSIDTGMGLERVTSVLQGVISNYDTDLFTPLIKRAAELTLGKGAGTAELRSAGQPGAAVPTSTETAHVGTAAPGCPAGQSPAAAASHKSAASLRVIADHSRAATFLISDGVLPANDGRGYVLRKIIRRAITHGRLLGQKEPFLHRMCFSVRDLMQDAYPELNDSIGQVTKIIFAEETRFAHTLDLGLERLEEQLAKQIEDFQELTNEKFGLLIESAINRLHEAEEAIDEIDTWPEPARSETKAWVESMQAKANASLDKAYSDHAELSYRAYSLGADIGARISEFRKLTSQAGVDSPEARFATHLADLERDLKMASRAYPGEKAFRLYDTFGMPLDFMQDAARDRGVSFDQEGFDRAMEEQKSRARASWKGGSKQTANPAYQQLPKSLFEGYRQTRSDGCEVLAIISKEDGHNGQGAQ